MFFGRIYQRGKPFRPSWRSYAGYAAIVALIMLAIEFDVLNATPGHPIGNLLLAIPAFYFVLAVVFIVNDLIVAGWRWYRGRRKVKRRK